MQKVSYSRQIQVAWSQAFESRVNDSFVQMYKIEILNWNHVKKTYGLYLKQYIMEWNTCLILKKLPHNLLSQSALHGLLNLYCNAPSKYPRGLCS